MEQETLNADFYRMVVDKIDRWKLIEEAMEEISHFIHPTAQHLLSRLERMLDRQSDISEDICLWEELFKTTKRVVPPDAAARLAKLAAGSAPDRVDVPPMDDEDVIIVDGIPVVDEDVIVVDGAPVAGEEIVIEDGTPVDDDDVIFIDKIPEDIEIPKSALLAGVGQKCEEEPSSLLEPDVVEVQPTPRESILSEQQGPSGRPIFSRPSLLSTPKLTPDQVNTTTELTSTREPASSTTRYAMEKPTVDDFVFKKPLPIKPKKTKKRKSETPEVPKILKKFKLQRGFQKPHKKFGYIRPIPPFSGKSFPKPPKKEKPKEPNVLIMPPMPRQTGEIVPCSALQTLPKKPQLQPELLVPSMDIQEVPPVVKSEPEPAISSSVVKAILPKPIVEAEQEEEELEYDEGLVIEEIIVHDWQDDVISEPEPEMEPEPMVQIFLKKGTSSQPNLVGIGKGQQGGMIFCVEIEGRLFAMRKSSINQKLFRITLNCASSKSDHKCKGKCMVEVRDKTSPISWFMRTSAADHPFSYIVVEKDSLPHTCMARIPVPVKMEYIDQCAAAAFP